MGINLQKGQKISLDKEAGGGLTRIVMGLGWDAAKSKGGMLGGLFGGGGGDSIDLDASCLMFDEAGNLLDTVWFRQLRSQDGSIQHSGDNRTGEGEGDDEQIQVNLASVPATRRKAWSSPSATSPARISRRSRMPSAASSTAPTTARSRATT